MTKINISRQTRNRIIGVAAVIITISIGIAAYLYISRDTNPLPSTIREQLTFSPFIIPTDKTNYPTSDYTFTTAEGQVQVLSYVIHLKSGSVTVSEYVQPPQFTDIPEYKDNFLTNIAMQYDTVQTANGTIYLGRLSKQDNKQLGILLEKGLIVFMSPSVDLKNTEWHSLGDYLEILSTN